MEEVKIFEKLVRYGVANATPIISGILITIILTKNLTVEEYGEYSILVASIGVVSGVFFSWLNNSLLRFYKNYQLINKEEELLKNYYTYYFGIGAFVLLLGIVFSFKLKHSILLSLAVIFLNLNNLQLTIYRSDGKDKKFMLQTILLNILKMLVIGYFILKLNLGIRGAILGLIIPSVLLNFRNLEYIEFNQEKLSFNILREAINYGLPIIGITLANQILANIDKYMLKILADEVSVGYYSFIYKVGEVSVGNVSKVLMLFAFPTIIEAYEKFGSKSAKKKIEFFMKNYILFCGILIGILLIVTPRVISKYFNEYSIATPLLKYIIFGLFFNGLCQYINKPFELKKETIKIFYLLLISGSINIISNIFLIPKYSYYGAAYSTLLSYLFYIFVSFIWRRGVKE